MRRPALIAAAAVLAASVVSLGALAILRDSAPSETVADPGPAEGRLLASQPDRASTLGYLDKCDVSALSPEGERAYRLLERLMVDNLTIDEANTAFDARGVLMSEDPCWPDGYPSVDPLVHDYSYPPQ